MSSLSGGGASFQAGPAATRGPRHAAPARRVVRRAAATRTAGRPGFRGDIQGLRAVAVVLVLLDHARIPGFSGGFVGVDVFFVISGFVITGQLRRQPDGLPLHRRIARFYAQRVRRLLPAASVTLLATLALSRYWLGAPASRSLAIDARWASLFGANWRFIRVGTNYFTADQSSLVLNYWSLGVEEQFYLVFPLALFVVLAIAVRTHRRNLLFGTLLSLVVLSSLWCVHETTVAPVSAYYSPLTRFWELGFGALLAVAPRPTRLPRATRTLVTWVGLAAIAAAGVLIAGAGAYPGALAWWPVAAAGCILWCGDLPDGSGAARLLELRGARFVGDISYSLYLWHYPILMLATARAGGELVPLTARLELLGLGFVIAVISYYYVEQPFRQWRLLRTRAGAPALLTGALIASVWGATFLVAAGGAPAVTQLIIAGASPVAVQNAVAASETATAVPTGTRPTPAQLADPQSAYAASGPAYFQACDPYLHASQAAHPVPCLMGDLTATKTIVLIGDSTAGNWAPALDKGLAKAGYRLAVFGYAGCPAPDVTYTAATAAQYTRCNTWHSHLSGAVRAVSPVAIVVVSGATDLGKVPDAAWSAGYGRLFDETTGGDTAVARILLGTSPDFDESVPDCLTAHANPQDCALNYSLGDGYYGSYVQRDEAVAPAVGARLVDTTRWFCRADRCEPVIGGYVAFTDSEHLTIDYSEYLSVVATDAVLGDLNRPAGT